VNQGSFQLSNNLGFKIKCTALSLPVGNEMKIIGSSGKNGGRSLEALEFSGCTQEGNGGKLCKVTSGKITTTLVLNLLGYSNTARTGPILVLFAPDNGTDFVTVGFTEEGEECKAKTALVEGNVVGRARANGTDVVVGTDELEAKHGEVNFDNVAHTILIENGGVLTQVNSKLQFAGNAAKLEGTALLLIDSGGAANWGVFTA
jgi:hypothetical protein